MEQCKCKGTCFPAPHRCSTTIHRHPTVTALGSSSCTSSFANMRYTHATTPCPSPRPHSLPRVQQCTQHDCAGQQLLDSSFASMTCALDPTLCLPPTLHPPTHRDCTGQQLMHQLVRQHEVHTCVDVGLHGEVLVVAAAEAPAVTQVWREALDRSVKYTMRRRCSPWRSTRGSCR